MEGCCNRPTPARRAGKILSTKNRVRRVVKVSFFQKIFISFSFQMKVLNQYQNTEKEEQSQNLIPTIRTAFTFCVITFEPIEV